MMFRAFILLPLALLLTPAPARAADPPEQWIVVTAPALRAALEPLCEHRKAQGMRVQVVQTTDVLREEDILTGAAARLRARVNRLCEDFKGTSYVLLVGAVDPGTGRDKLADAAKKVGIGPFDGSVAMRFLDAGHRRSWAKQLEAARGHERDAHDALRAAREGMR